MCLITASKKGTLLDDDRFRASDHHNSDGVGIMFIDDGRVRVLKNLGNTETKLNLYKSLPASKPHVLHQRFATHGNKDVKMCHPFRVTDKDKHGLDIFVMHNGVLSGLDMHTKGKSDTWHFVKDYLRPILSTNPHILRNKGFKRMLGSLIEKGNKLAFLDSDGVMTIINRESGTVQGDFWFSNTYSLVGSSRTSFPSNTTRNYYNDWNWEDDYYANGYTSRRYVPGIGYCQLNSEDHRILAAAQKAVTAANKGTVVPLQKPLQLPPPPPTTPPVEETAAGGVQSEAPFDADTPSDDGGEESDSQGTRAMTDPSVETALGQAYSYLDADFEDGETRGDFAKILSHLDFETLEGFVTDNPRLITFYLFEKLKFHA